MTLPNERTRALVNSKRFLRSLLDPRATPRVPLAIRRAARNCLKHYPAEFEIDKLPKCCPKLFGKSGL